LQSLVVSHATNLFASHLVKHCGQPTQVPDNQGPVLALDNAYARKAIEFAAYGLPMGAYAACNLRMRGRRFEARAVTFSLSQARQSQQLRLDAIVDRERAEFIHAFRQSANIPNEAFYERLSYVRLTQKELSE
jgi:hypothetical protein